MIQKTQMIQTKDCKNTYRKQTSDRGNGSTEEKGSAILLSQVKNSGNKLKPWRSTCGVQIGRKTLSEELQPD